MNALTQPQASGHLPLASQAQSNILSAQAMLPKSMEQALVFAERLANSGLAPAGFNGKPDACFIAMQYGAALGLNPLQAVQNIAVINGRPCLWGDAALALVRSSPLCEWVKETLEGNTAYCTVKRKGEPEPQTRRYSWDDAQTAGLTHKAGPWKQYPKRMLQLRARAFALRDIFPDALMGLGIAEEIRDITPSENAAEQFNASVTKTLQDYPQEKLEEHLPQWQQSGKAPEQIISMVSSKYQLTDAQKAQIRALQLPQENQRENNDGQVGMRQNNEPLE